MTPELKAKIEAAKARAAKTLAAAKEQPVEPVKAASTELAVQVDLMPKTLVVVDRPVEVEAVREEVPTNLDVNNPVHAAFLQRLGDLEAALLARDPLMPTHLGEIHRTLQTYDEIAPLLTVEEISRIMAAQQTHVAVFLRSEVVKGSKAAAAKKTAKVTLEDI